MPSAAQLVLHKKILSLGWPLLLSTLTTPLLGLVDTAVMGRMPDSHWLGAVALGTVIFNILFWSFGSLRLSTIGFAAQALGAGDAVEQQASLLRPFFAGLAIGGVLIAVHAPVIDAALWIMGATGLLSDLARDYTTIRIFAAPLTLANYALVGWFLGRGQTQITLAVQLTINLVNIALSLWCVLVWNMGITGVALATVGAEATGFLIAVFAAHRSLRRLAVARDWAVIFCRHRLLALTQVNGDLFIRTACLALAFGFFTTLSTSAGADVLAANTVLLQFVTLAAHILDTAAHVAEILTGQAKGAKNRALFAAAVRQSSLWAGGIAVVLALLFWLGGALALPLLTDLPQVQTLAEQALPWAMLSPLFGVASYQLDGIFTGTTQTTALRNAMLQSVTLYLPAAVILQQLYGNHGLWLAFSGFSLLRAVTLIRYDPRLLTAPHRARVFGTGQGHEAGGQRGD